MKNDKRRRDIKSKLIAAICMLMVSCIMMVSTTYAWFTLSTAPEVTGISTAVGANGNLEMALLPTSGLTSDITTGVGDSMVSNDVTDANVTWGNLVDLSDSSYGLDSIVLMPSALNVAEGANGDVIPGVADGSDIHLQTPSYGSDGRVSDLAANTVANGADANGLFTLSDSTVYGVRAVGTTSSMTDRQLAYRNYRANASTAAASASRKAEAALASKGEVIASMAITHATASDEKYYDTDLDALEAIVTALNGDGGAFEDIENALKNYILATIVSAKNTSDDVTVMAFVNTYKNSTLAELLAASEVSAQLGNLTDWTTIYNQYTGMVQNMTDAGAMIAALRSEPAGTTTDANGATVNYYAWGHGADGQIREILGYFANPDYLVINDMTADEISADLNAFINATMANNMAIDVIVPTGAGVFADLADFCGNYDVPITLHNISYGSIGPVDMPATMYAETTLTSTHLSSLAAVVTGFGAPAASQTAGTSISDLYGYVIDLAFRTNASNANLQLQTTAVDRIYSNNTDVAADTMGGGASMTFQGQAGFDTTMVLALMENINVVFYDTESGEIYGIAKLDTANPVSTDTTLYKVTANLYLYNYKITDYDNGVIAFGDKKADASIVALTQNTAETISVLVYLDGNRIENSDVANGTTSMTGSLNLQFSTDATLTPMNYTPLMPSSDGSTATTAPTEAATEATTEAP